MTLVQYTAEVKDGLLLELPAEAEELHLKPGDKVQIQLNRSAEDAFKVRPKEKNLTTGTQEANKPKELRGRGMLAGVLSSEEFMRRKRME